MGGGIVLIWTRTTTDIQSMLGEWIFSFKLIN